MSKLQQTVTLAYFPKTNRTMKYALSLSILFCTFSCQNKDIDSQIQVETVSITNFEGLKMKPKDITSNIQVLPLHTDTAGYIGQIKDICAIDSSIYLLDGSDFSLCKFNRKNGLLLQRISSRGNGPLEYLQPIALTSDDDHIYVLDLPGMSILSYNTNLQAEKKISTSFPCLDFIRTEKGFLCYNLSPTENLQQIVYLDNKGQIISSYQLNHNSQAVSTGSKIFNRNSQGKIFITIPFSRTIYTWDTSSEKPIEYLSFDYTSQNIPDDIELDKVNIWEKPYAIPCQFFQAKESFLQSFLYQEKRYHYIKSDSGNKLGTIPEDSEFPFFPQWQIDDYLVGTCSSDLLFSVSNYYDGEVLLFYTLK